MWSLAVVMVLVSRHPEDKELNSGVGLCLGFDNKVLGPGLSLDLGCAFSVFLKQSP